VIKVAVKFIKQPECPGFAPGPGMNGKRKTQGFSKSALRQGCEAPVRLLKRATKKTISDAAGKNN